MQLSNVAFSSVVKWCLALKRTGLFWFFFSYHISGVPVAFAQKYSIVLIKRSDSSCDTVNPGRSDSVGTRYIPWQRDRKVAFAKFRNNQDTIVVITTGS